MRCSASAMRSSNTLRSWRVAMRRCAAAVVVCVMDPQRFYPCHAGDCGARRPQNSRMFKQAPPSSAACCLQKVGGRDS